MSSRSFITKSAAAIALIAASLAVISAGDAEAGPVVRDHRTQSGVAGGGFTVRDHRTPSGLTVRDHRIPPLASAKTTVHRWHAASCGRGYCGTTRAPGGVMVTTHRNPGPR